MNKKIILISLIFLIIGFFIGRWWIIFDYNDKCLDMGGGKNPGNNSICVIKK